MVKRRIHIAKSIGSIPITPTIFMQNLSSFRKEFKLKADPKRAKGSGRFFKTGKGEYGEGDVFLGLTSAQIREIAYKFKELSLKEIQELLKSKIHEERVAALRILVHQFQGVMRSHNIRDMRQSGAMTSHSVLRERQKVEQGKAHEIFNFYLKNIKYVNNWDLVDMSAPKIIGDYLFSTSLKGSRQVLYRLAKSKNLWERRIAIVSTYAFIRQNKPAPLEMSRYLKSGRRKYFKKGESLTGFEDTLKIAKILLSDKHDLIHKAVGWMLREVGKRSQLALEKFLKANYKIIPRTMLRYAIEKFPEKKRKMYLLGKTC